MVEIDHNYGTVNQFQQILIYKYCLDFHCNNNFMMDISILRVFNKGKMIKYGKQKCF